MADSKISKSLFRNLGLRILVECLPDQGPCLDLLIVIGKASGDPGYDRWIVIEVWHIQERLRIGECFQSLARFKESLNLHDDMLLWGGALL